MNVTISGNTKSNFFVAKDQIQQNAYKPNMHLRMIATNQAKANMIKIGPITRGFNMQSQKWMRTALGKRIKASTLGFTKVSAGLL